MARCQQIPPGAGFCQSCDEAAVPLKAVLWEESGAAGAAWALRLHRGYAWPSLSTRTSLAACTYI